MASRVRLSLLPFVLCICIPLVAATCYYPNGSPDSEHRACGSSGGATVCCAEGFQCLSNGLCGDPRYPDWQRILRGGCTDKTWGSGCPPNICTSAWQDRDLAVYYCGGGKYCCDGQDCCQSSGTTKFDYGEPRVVGIASQISAETATSANGQASSSPTVAAPPANTAANDASPKRHSNKLAIAVGVGVGVGGGVIVLVFALVLALMCLRRRKRRAATVQEAQCLGDDAADSLDCGKHQRGKGSGDLVELDATRAHEMDAKGDPKEIEGTEKSRDGLGDVGMGRTG